MKFERLVTGMHFCATFNQLAFAALLNDASLTVNSESVGRVNSPNRLLHHYFKILIIQDSDKPNGASSRFLIAISPSHANVIGPHSDMILEPLPSNERISDQVEPPR